MRFHLSRFVTKLCIGLIGALLPLGCGQRTNPPAVQQAIDEFEEIAAPQSSALPTMVDCEQFATMFETAVMRADLDYIKAHIHYRETLNRATYGKIPKAFRQSFLSKQMRRINQDGPAAQLFKVVQEKGSFKYFRCRVVGSEARMLFRLLLPESGGLDYIEFVLGKNSLGILGIIDAFSLSSGELLSTSLRDRMLIELAGQPASASEFLSVSEKEYQSAVPLLREMDNRARDDKPQEILATITKLPVSVRNKKSVRLLELSASLKADFEDHKKRLAEYRNQFPDDSAPDLLYFETYAVRKQYELAHTCIARLHKNFNRDGYLEHLRSCIYLEQRDFASAKNAAEAALLKEPHLNEPYWTLIVLSVEMGDFNKTLAQLKALDSEVNAELADVSRRPELAPFVKSPQYQEWLRYKATKKGGADAGNKDPPRP